jgi:hypothetical protein
VGSADTALHVACFFSVCWLAYSLTVEVETLSSSETSVNFCRTTRRYMPEDITLQSIELMRWIERGMANGAKRGTYDRFIVVTV